MDFKNHKLIHHFLEHSAQRYPDKTALVHEETRATYAQVNSQANQLAHWLTEQGVGVGDRVVLLFENCLEYIVSYYGILKAGAAVVPLSTELKPKGLKEIFLELEPKIIIASSRFKTLLKEIDINGVKPVKIVLKLSTPISFISEIPVILWDELFKKGVKKNSTVKIDESHLASIIYTSGSTGKPKGAMLTHANIICNTHSICEYLKIGSNDIQMVVLPLFYVMGKSLLNTHFAAGGTIVINNKIAFPAGVLQQMIKENVTSFSGVPSTYAYLLHRSPLRKFKEKLTSLRYCSQAGGHMDTEIKKDLRKVLPLHTDIIIMYGATEAAARLTYLSPENYSQKTESIGKPIPNVKIDVVDQKGKSLPANKTGELVAFGNNIMQGYWEDKDATEKVLVNRGYYTGDLGYYDEDGFLYVIRRKDNLIKSGGHRINPLEIEEVLMGTRQWIEAEVIGVPDKLLGKKIVALVSPKDGDCNVEDLLRECSQKLPKFKLPSKITMVKTLPKSPNGKIDRQKCIEILRRNMDLNNYSSN